MGVREGGDVQQIATGRFKTRGATEDSAFVHGLHAPPGKLPGRPEPATVSLSAPL